MAPLHILFTDDDTDESYLFNEAIEHSGLNVVLSYANDGNRLLSILKNYSLPDVVVIDINMPHKDGLEALTEIRNDPEFEKLPIVIYSTTSNAKIIEMSYQKGANLFMVKPDNFDEMVKMVKRIGEIDWRSNPKQSRAQFVISTESI